MNNMNNLNNMNKKTGNATTYKKQGKSIQLEYDLTSNTPFTPIPSTSHSQNDNDNGNGNKESKKSIAFTLVIAPIILLMLVCIHTIGFIKFIAMFSIAVVIPLSIITGVIMLDDIKKEEENRK